MHENGKKRARVGGLKKITKSGTKGELAARLSKVRQKVEEHGDARGVCVVSVAGTVF